MKIDICTMKGPTVKMVVLKSFEEKGLIGLDLENMLDEQWGIKCRLLRNGQKDRNVEICMCCVFALVINYKSMVDDSISL